MKFNEAQQKAIAHGTGPMLVLAGPGSGKTAVITRRVWELVKKGAAPGSILVITFTKAAAIQMQERYLALREKEGPQRTGQVNFGTFHAVFFKILKYAYQLQASNIVSEEESYRILSDLVSEMEMEIDDEKEFLEGIRSEISRIKSERIDIATYYSMNCPEEEFRKLYNGYEREMRKKNRIDFDDILLFCYDLLVKRPDILRMWQQKYRYILIDEFQDINRIQYDIIRLLAQPEDNLFIVGDDDQSIYRFRGAKPEIMLNFTKDYPDAGQVLLNYNYRSQKEIVETALNLVSHNEKRFPKEILSTREAMLPVITETFPSQEEEGERILEVIRGYHAKGMPYREMAILFRTNTQARGIMGKLMAYNVPFRMKDTVPNLFEHWIAKDIIAYLRMAQGERDRSLFLRVMNRPNRYISRESLQEPVVDLDRLKWRYREKDWMAERIGRLEYDLSALAKVNPFAAITYIRRGIGYDEYLISYAEYRRMKPEELLETITELQESARGFDTCEEWFSYMERYKKELTERRENRADKTVEGVVLATMHSAKGLEYELVILPEVNEGIIPYKRAVSEEELEEERRMYYVAMTRAKNFLYVFSVCRLHGKEMQKSRFVGEMAVKQELLNPGTHLEHKVYGKGILTVRDKKRAIVYFERLGTEKILDLEVCQKQELIKITEKG